VRSEWRRFYPPEVNSTAGSLIAVGGILIVRDLKVRARIG
jgi:hypothetical protein